MSTGTETMDTQKKVIDQFHKQICPHFLNYFISKEIALLVRGSIVLLLCVLRKKILCVASVITVPTVIEKIHCVITDNSV